MSCERKFRKENLDAFKIGGNSYICCDTIEPYLIGKGDGSVFGGQWRPNPSKPQDQCLLGEPGEVKTNNNLC